MSAVESAAMTDRLRAAISILLLGYALVAVAPTIARGASIERDIRFVAPDGVELVGVLALPGDDGAKRPERGWPVAILIHTHARTADGFVALSDELARRGIASVRMDQRGHGASRKADEGRRLYTFPLLPERHIRSETADQRQLVTVLREDPDIDIARLAFVGVGVGGQVAAEASWQIPHVRALVIVDPDDPVAGFDPGQDIGLFGTRPVLFVCSGVPRSGSRAQALAQFGHGERTVSCVDSYESYDRLLLEDEPATIRVAEWLVSTLGVAP